MATVILQASLRTSRAAVRRLYSSETGLMSRETSRLQQRLKGKSTRLLLPDPHEDVLVKKRTLTLMVGWMSSSLRAVEKHATLYTSVGIPVLCVAPDSFQVWSTRLGSRLTSSLLTTLDECLESPVSMVLHTFSGASHACLPAMVSYFESGSDCLLTRKMNISCAVFDSCPPFISYKSGLIAARLIYDQGGFTYPVYLAAASMGFMANVLIGHKKRIELDTCLRSPLLDVPQLYLHSQVDQVATLSQVQKVILDQKAMGREVFSHCFKDSQHVRHYIEDPTTYEHHVHSLLKRCQLI